METDNIQYIYEVTYIVNDNLVEEFEKWISEVVYKTMNYKTLVTSRATINKVNKQPFSDMFEPDTSTKTKFIVQYYAVSKLALKMINFGEKHALIRQARLKFGDNEDNLKIKGRELIEVKSFVQQNK